MTLLNGVEPTERLLSPDTCILRGGPCDWSGASSDLLAATINTLPAPD
ncbi:MAG: hypothetical protein ABFS21_07720 [Actinomycetota bacterium]